MDFISLEDGCCWGHFERSRCLRHQDDSLISLMMEAAGTSEVVNVLSGDSHVCTKHRENLLRKLSQRLAIFVKDWHMR